MGLRASRRHDARLRISGSANPTPLPRPLVPSIFQFDRLFDRARTGRGGSLAQVISRTGRGTSWRKMAREEVPTGRWRFSTPPPRDRRRCRARRRRVRMTGRRQRNGSSGHRRGCGVRTPPWRNWLRRVIVPRHFRGTATGTKRRRRRRRQR